MKTTPAQKRAKEKYTKENTRAYCLRLNKKTDQDIMAKLEAVESMQGYIKRLIREDLKRS